MEYGSKVLKLSCDVYKVTKYNNNNNNKIWQKRDLAKISLSNWLFFNSNLGTITL